MADKRQGGFTLVEIMISLTVLSLITLGTLTALRTLANTHERLGETTDRVDEMRQVSQFLRNSLQQAQVATAVASATIERSSSWARYNTERPSGSFVRSEPDEVIWIAPLDSIQGISGMSYIRLYREDSLLKVQFLPEYQGIPDMNAFAWEQAGDAYVLVDELEEFAIAYRPLVDADWLDRLEAGSEIPQAVSITIKARGRFWPEILVAPHEASG